VAAAVAAAAPAAAELADVLRQVAGGPWRTLLGNRERKQLRVVSKEVQLRVDPLATRLCLTSVPHALARLPALKRLVPKLTGLQQLSVCINANVAAAADLGG
jgi:hypothetical protein